MKYNNKENIDENLLILDSLYLNLNYYKQQLYYLDKHKPFRFQKKKLNEYNNEINNVKRHIKIYENKIKEYIDNKIK